MCDNMCVHGAHVHTQYVPTRAILGGCICMYCVAQCCSLQFICYIFALRMLRAIGILAQPLKVGVSACLEPVARVGKSLHGRRRSTMDSGNVQALAAGFSLANKRQRGAALAGVFLHGAMCALACARRVYVIMLFRVCSETLVAVA